MKRNKDHFKDSIISGWNWGSFQGGNHFGGSFRGLYRIQNVPKLNPIV